MPEHDSVELGTTARAVQSTEDCVCGYLNLREEEIGLGFAVITCEADFVVGYKANMDHLQLFEMLGSVLCGISGL